MNTLAYKVEIFERLTLRNYYHLVKNEVAVGEDYLSPVNNTLTVPRTEDIVNGDFIRIQGDGVNYFGVIMGVEQGEIETTVLHKAFIGIFDNPCLFDTNWQGTISLEEALESLITSGWISNADASANIPLTVTRRSSTAFGLNLKADVEGSHLCVINLYNSVIARALSKYGITITAEPNFTTRKVDLTIGKVTASPLAIEADLPTVISRNIVLLDKNTDVNKLTVWNLATGSGKATYYLYTDGTYGTADRNRVLPVVEAMGYVGDVTQETFTTQAARMAAETFGQIEYNNLIEIEAARDDSRIDPLNILIGQEVTVWTRGRQIKSILTGRSIGASVTLTFGAFRMKLTDIIKEIRRNG